MSVEKQRQLNVEASSLSPRACSDLRCASVAARQHGVLSRAQAMGFGLKASAVDRRVRTRRWERLRPGVFRVAGAPETPSQLAMAACLWAGEDAVVSHLSAARLWRLDGLPPEHDSPGQSHSRGLGELHGPNATLTLSLPPGRQVQARDLRTHRNTKPLTQDRTFVDGVPVTRVTRTLIDLAGILSEEQLELACADAFRRRLSSPGRVLGRLRQLGRKGRLGVPVLVRILEQRAPSQSQTQSALESRVLQTLRRARLPAPELQYRVTHGERWLAQVDFAYPDARLAIEADGRRYHETSSAFERDRVRGAELASIGWRVLRVTWRALKEEPERFAEQVRGALEDRTGS